MAFLAQVLAYLLQWILTLGGKALYEWSHEFIDKQKQKKQEKENLKKNQDAEKKGNKDEILESERDLINS